jgi:hypothetical protein
MFFTNDFESEKIIRNLFDAIVFVLNILKHFVTNVKRFQKFC